MRTHRRDFLKTSLAASTLVSLGGATVPTFLGRTARAASGSSTNERILVVVQLTGGNDGLNTVVPHGMDGYARHRRALRLAPGTLHKINDQIGLHPSMGGMAKLIEAGHLAVVQGVGYPNPDRSHFRSMEIWETARTDPGRLETGWLGRAIDRQDPREAADIPAVHIGGPVRPLALKATRVEAPSLDRLDQFRLQLAGAPADRRMTRAALNNVARVNRDGDDPLLGFVRRSTLAAYSSSQRLESLVPAGVKSQSYPNFELARRFELIARLIKAEFGTRIYYTRLDGFDTHAYQLATHAALLTELSDSLAAFHADLAEAGIADRVATLAFSEFGRRVAENASQGTDHGAAAPVFLVGPVANPGLVGDHPSLETLNDGDLIHHTDFRRIYATLLDHWLGLSSAPIVGPEFTPLDLFAARA